MSAANQKGTRKETQVVNLAKTRGFPDARREANKGARDEGDVQGIPDLCVEVKYRGPGQPLNLGGAVDESLDEAVNAGARWAVAAVHRARKPVEETYAVMPLGEFLDLYRDYLDARNYGEAMEKVQRIARELAFGRGVDDHTLRELSMAVALVEASEKESA